jgi:heme-degrading monooxygenase HmoA
MAISLFPPTPTRLPSQYSQSAHLYSHKSFFNLPPYHASILRDNFTLTTWLLLAAFAQYSLTLLLRPSLAILPALLLLVYTFLSPIIYPSNPYPYDPVSGRTAAAFPSPNDPSTSVPPSHAGPGAIMILGARSNSPLGIFAPNFRHISRHFNRMIRSLESSPETGFLGASTWISNERSSNNEVATISYWRSVEDIHAFAVGSVHREAMQWWDGADTRRLGIMHEVFVLPREGGWEGVYVNYPRTGLGAATREGEGGWAVLLVEATGRWTSSRGRLGMGVGGKGWVEMKGEGEDEKVEMNLEAM